MDVIIDDCQLVTVAETVAALRISHSTLYEMFKTGELNNVKVRRRTFVRLCDLRAFLAQGQG
jgi:hypothetical protein